MEASAERIVAHRWQSPWGICPCGYMVYVRDEVDLSSEGDGQGYITKESPHTCEGCNNTFQIEVFPPNMKGYEDYRAIADHRRLDVLRADLYAKGKQSA